MLLTFLRLRLIRENKMYKNNVVEICSSINNVIYAKTRANGTFGLRFELCHCKKTSHKVIKTRSAVTPYRFRFFTSHKCHYHCTTPSKMVGNCGLFVTLLLGNSSLNPLYQKTCNFSLGQVQILVVGTYLLLPLVVYTQVIQFIHLKVDVMGENYHTVVVNELYVKLSQEKKIKKSQVLIK